MSYYSSDESEDGFERLHPDFAPSGVRMTDEQQAERIRSLLINSTAHEAPCEPADGKTPEVCYVLNYVASNRKIVEGALEEPGLHPTSP